MMMMVIHLKVSSDLVVGAHLVSWPLCVLGRSFLSREYRGSFQLMVAT